MNKLSDIELTEISLMGGKEVTIVLCTKTDIGVTRRSFQLLWNLPCCNVLTRKMILYLK